MPHRDHRLEGRGEHLLEGNNFKGFNDLRLINGSSHVQNSDMFLNSFPEFGLFCTCQVLSIAACHAFRPAKVWSARHTVTTDLKEEGSTCEGDDCLICAEMTVLYVPCSLAMTALYAPRQI